ncbi:elongation factor G [Sphingosinicella ginsenosidimutans]|uniref:Elongation factor G n=1 Tax=Allosphingosinicella ginsenosidimutans TaxID=1176539 RepID=A0A5C6TW87_9SPHN|nr:elongation factor G [Sphingosinicella ginsenosidimutans]TXC64420.1 elongation factor G [Sphingosinicella ginsenosidimutans]
MPERAAGTRTIALVGPGGAGKTSLAEALLFAAGATSRQGSVADGSCVGDASPEARARGGSTEINLVHLDYMGDRYVFIDTPGSVGFVADGALGVAAADLAIVVVDPDADRALLAEPTLRQLERLGVPHMIFVNKIDQARGSIQTLLESLQPMSDAPLIARWIPIRDGEKITGFVDIALERAYYYRPGQPSEQKDVPPDLAEREGLERTHMLEQLADHDDALLEALLMDEIPDRATVYADLARETGEGHIAPVLFGSATSGFGVRRLLKTLRHEAPAPSAAAERLGAADGCAFVFKVSHGGSMGRLTYARVFGGSIREGQELKGPGGAAIRIGTLFCVQGDKTVKIPEAGTGDVVAIAKLEGVGAGEWLSSGKAPPSPGIGAPVRNFALAIATRDRKDDVRLSTALHKLTEEDRALHWEQDETMHETRLKGVNDEHLKVTLDRLQRRYGVAVDARPPAVGYKESIRKSVTQRGRHKKQSGGHGQFGDVVIEVKPLARGEGFRFGERISGGVVPKQWIPAVEDGVRDALAKGPLGFPVVDVEVTLVDGSYHTVDSSEIAFRTAGRIAMSEALAAAAPHLLEPVLKVTVVAPSVATSRITSAIASRRGQMLGMGPREGWSRWDQIEALIPEAEMQGFDAELRSLSQGLATYEATFDHLAELNGTLAEKVVQREMEPA